MGCVYFDYATFFKGKNMQNTLSKLREEELPKSTLVSRNVTIMGRRTSVRLEPEMWIALKEISKRENCSIHDICSLISLRKNENTSLTAAVRVFLMLYFRASSTEDGHQKAGHGSFEQMKQRARVDVRAQPSTRAVNASANGRRHKSEHKVSIVPRRRDADYEECRV